MDLATRLMRIASFVFSARRKPEVESPRLIKHLGGIAWLSAQYNRPDARVLEIGSRIVRKEGTSYRSAFSNATYVGFDVLPGPNVDIVGDAHRLSSYFREADKFDLVFSIAVFEHLYAPWLVASEIAKVLKVGGCAHVETHFSYRNHDRPWNFFQFSDAGLRVLFNPALGFDVLDSGMSNPIRGYFAAGSDDYLRFRTVDELYCHSSVFARKTLDAPNFDWRDCKASDLVGETAYPAISV